MDTTNEPSAIDNGPDSIGDSSDVNRIKFGADHPKLIPWINQLMLPIVILEKIIKTIY